jgi:hypothetical protein
MSECENCAAAAADALWGGYTATCQGCKARMIARSPAYWESRQSGRQTEAYRALLKAEGLTHEQVKRAALIDEGAP